MLDSAGTRTAIPAVTPPPPPEVPSPSTGGGVEVDYAPTDDEILERDRPDMARLINEARAGTLVYDNNGGQGVPVLPAIGLGVGAFVIVGLFLWAGQRTMHYADGLRPGLSHGASREVASSDPENGGAAALRTPAYRSPAAPGVSSAPFRATVTSSGPALPPSPRIGKGPFVGEAERESARQSLLPLHDLMGLMQKYDGIALSSVGGSGAPGDFRPPAVVVSGGVAPVTVSGPPPSGAGSGGALFTGGSATARAAAQQTASINAERVQMETEAIAAQVNLCTHDELFPTALRPPMKEARKEAHAYLIDIKLAAGDEAQRSALRSAANRRLARARSLVQYMDGIVAGSTDPNETPMP